MKLAIISFTEKGKALSKQVKQSVTHGYEVELYCKSKHCRPDPEDIVEWKERTVTWAEKQFAQKNALLFIGACGIAVRAIASSVRDKLTDAPVLVMDETGTFVIPILSGHYGGANELAEWIAETMGAQAVVTTATDRNRKFAVDVFAGKNNLIIQNREGIKEISAAILAGEQVTIALEGVYRGEIPKELTLVASNPMTACDILLSPNQPKGRCRLWLCPRVWILGIGCKKGKTAEEIEEAVKEALQVLGLNMAAVAGIASIDRKKEEPGLCEFARKQKLPFTVFTGQELAEIKGTYTTSEFVSCQMGVDNVCERAAMAGAGEGGTLKLKKQAKNGITVAAAIGKWSVEFGAISNTYRRNRTGTGRNDELTGNENLTRE